MVLPQVRTTRTNGIRAGLILAIAASAWIAGTPALSEEKPSPFEFRILPSDQTCLEPLPEVDTELKELKVKACGALMIKEQADCTRTGGTVLVADGQTRCRKAGGVQEYVRGGVKLPTASAGPTVPVGPSLGTKAVAPAGGCVLRPGAPPVGASCGRAK